MESSDEEDVQTALVLGLILRRRRRRSAARGKRRMWVRPLLQMRIQQGTYNNLIKEMRLCDRESHFSFLRMSKETFDVLLQKVSPFLCRRGYFSNLRAEVSPAERLALTLRYLATGNSQVSLSFSFRLGRSTVCSIIRETCGVIWNVLAKDYVKVPSSVDEWKRISQDFYLKWNFPNCIGAIDGKHIVVQAPKRSGSLYFNYKGTFSVILMAVCDANYRFILIDLGGVGRHCDGGIFSNSSYGRALEDGQMVLPNPSPLPGTTEPELPYVLVGDAAFPLRNYLLRPYPGRNLPGKIFYTCYLEDQAIFNYRLSRARRIIENTFGILASRWRLFRRPIIANPDNVVVFTKAAIALHNFLKTTESTVYCPPGFVDGEDEGNVVRGSWREDERSSSMTNVAMTSSNRYLLHQVHWYSRSAAETRMSFKEYFNSAAGEVSWQYRHIRRTT